MKHLKLTGILLVSLAGCTSASNDESVGKATQDLNGTLSPLGFLVKRNTSQSTEFDRRNDTNTYYGSVHLGPTGTDPATILTGLATLGAFQRLFGLSQGLSGEYSAKYYNRGDLGLGRDMHCRKRASDQQIGCYVTNYATGTGEFTFGLDARAAFNAMNAPNPQALATVAMIYRPAMSGPNKMIFLAYDGSGALTYNAPLDRHGVSFAQEYKRIADLRGESPLFGAQDDVPDVNTFGAPGNNFNNHIPSNCQNCHGGIYNAAGVTAGVFLPWDLDQFEFDNTNPQTTRATQEVAFSSLNQLAKSVATTEGRQSIVDQINGWYAKDSATFDSTYVPPGWSANASDRKVYYDVVRRSCRGCHITLFGDLSFDSAANFLALADDGTKLAGNLTSHSMPHALQTQRDFWLSSQPLELETWLRTQSTAQGTAGPTAVANVLQVSGPGTLITLDPPAITAATGF